MKRITLSAEAGLIQLARLRASREGRRLHAAFREWLEQCARGGNVRAGYAALMERLSHVRAAGPISREERNRR